MWANLGHVEVLDIDLTPHDTWQVEWRVPGESGVASHTVTPRLDCGALKCLLTDIVQTPASPTPIWLTGPVRVHRAEGVAVIGGPAAAQWLTAARQAASVLTALDVDGLLRPPAVQVVEVPADTRAFEQVMAAPAFDFAATGALTWQVNVSGPHAAGAPAATRIVVNPNSTQNLDQQSRSVLMLHEQVHAATSWLGSPSAGQRWVSEGLAEWLMLQESPDELERSRAVLAASCPAPDTAPSDGDFADPARLALAYARSAEIVGQVLAEQPGAAARLAQLWQTPGARPAFDQSLVGCR